MFEAGRRICRGGFDVIIEGKKYNNSLEKERPTFKGLVVRILV